MNNTENFRYETDTEHPDEVVFNEGIHEEYYNIYKPDGTLLARSCNTLALNDVLLQIMRKKLEGYTLVMDGDENRENVSQLTLDGRVKNAPYSLNEISDNQLFDLLGF